MGWQYFSTMLKRYRNLYVTCSDSQYTISNSCACYGVFVRAAELSAEEKVELEKYLISPFEFDIIPLDMV